MLNTLFRLVAAMGDSDDKKYPTDADDNRRNKENDNKIKDDGSKSGKQQKENKDNEKKKRSVDLAKDGPKMSKQSNVSAICLFFS